MEATLEFLADIPLWKEERPYQIFFKTDGAVSDSNCHFETHSGVHIEDVKALTWKPTLETDGFELVTTHYQKNLSIPNFEDPSKMQSVVIPYLQLTRSFLKSRLGAEDVICFDWRVRSLSVTALNMFVLTPLLLNLRSGLRADQIKIYVIWKFLMMYATK